MSENTREHTRRIFLRNAAMATGTAAFTPSLLQQALALEPGNEPVKRPNLVFFCGEGVRPDETSLSGNKILKTPNLDRMGREGAVFQNAFCTNALCLPARATMLSGMYSHTTGAVDNQSSKVPDNFPLVSDLIRDSGYEVAFIGKSHVEGALLDRYWDYYFGFEGGANYFHPLIVEGFKGKYGKAKVYDDYVDDLLTRKAVEWLAQPHDKPVCLFLWFYAPHAPFYRPLRAVNDFNGVPIPKPESFDEYLLNYPGKPESVKKALNKIGTQFYEGDEPRSLEELVKDHYVGVETNDQHIGEVFQVFEKKGQMDDTAFMWSSDHGFFLGEHRFYDKRLMYEPSIRIPLIVRYPLRIQAGTTSDKMVLNVDFAPTLLDLVGLPIPSAFQGKSVMPLIEGKNVPWRKDWLYEYYEYPGYENIRPNRGVRTERYKYIHYFVNPQEFELYDLQADPNEMHNLYGNPKYADLTRQLAARLEELRRETKDTYQYKPTVLLKDSNCEPSHG